MCLPVHCPTFLCLMKSNGDFTLEECVLASVWVHERKHSNDNVKKVTDTFHERFGTDPSSRQTGE